MRKSGVEIGLIIHQGNTIKINTVGYLIRNPAPQNCPETNRLIGPLSLDKAQGTKCKHEKSGK